MLGIFLLVSLISVPFSVVSSHSYAHNSVLPNLRSLPYELKDEIFLNVEGNNKAKFLAALLLPHECSSFAFRVETVNGDKKPGFRNSWIIIDRLEKWQSQSCLVPLLSYLPNLKISANHACRHCGLSMIPGELVKRLSLDHITSHQMEEIKLRKFRHLIHLEIRTTAISYHYNHHHISPLIAETLFRDLGTMSQLQRLDLSGSHLGVYWRLLQPALSNLSNLTYLDLSWCDMDRDSLFANQFFSSFQGLLLLETLRLKGNKMSQELLELSLYLKSLKRLKVLDLSENKEQLETFFHSIPVENLVKLDLSDNGMQAVVGPLSRVLPSMHRLSHLDLTSSLIPGGRNQVQLKVKALHHLFESVKRIDSLTSLGVPSVLVPSDVPSFKRFFQKLPLAIESIRLDGIVIAFGGDQEVWKHVLLDALLPAKGIRHISFSRDIRRNNFDFIIPNVLASMENLQSLSFELYEELWDEPLMRELLSLIGEKLANVQCQIELFHPIGWLNFEKIYREAMASNPKLKIILTEQSFIS